jgi:hypothetical protein
MLDKMLNVKKKKKMVVAEWLSCVLHTRVNDLETFYSTKFNQGQVKIGGYQLSEIAIKNF